jgi:hypothetical protein
MGKSRGFGSTATNYFALFRLGFPTASDLKSLTLLVTITRRFILQKARRHAYKALRLLVSIRFQVLFHSPPGVLFTFPSRYWFTIGRQVVFSLRGWSPQIPTGFHVSRGTWDTLCSFVFSSTGVLPPMPGLSSPLRLKQISRDESPATPIIRRLLVWAFPRSLAATYGITIVFFSSGYLDVSVPRVASLHL